MTDTLRELSDVELLLAYRRGDVDAFQTIYDRYGDRLYFYARSVTGGGEAAGDLVQEAFLRLMRLESAPADRPLAPFLFTVVRNLAVDARRRAAVRGRPIPAGPAAEGAVGFVEAALDVEDLVRALPAGQREVVLLKIYGGLTFAEIADVTAEQLSTVASRFRYALGKLAGLLADEGSAR